MIVLFGDVGVVEKAKSFGLGVDFLASHGDFQGFLCVIKTFVHNADGADGNHAKNTDSEHDFDKSVTL